MGKVSVLLAISVSIGTCATLFHHFLIVPHPVPDVQDEFWGPSITKHLPEDAKVRPFKINVSEDVLTDLKDRLELELASFSSRMPPPLEGVAFEYGFNLDYLRKFGNYWLKEYNWRKREVLLNKYPHFQTTIGGLNIHFQHIKPKGDKKKEIRPVLILHGWPGSFVEFQKLIPLLGNSEMSKYDFEIIIPSLPGFAFSSASAREGMSCTEMGNIFQRLMHRLGHKKYFLMGGDWGAVIAADMAVLYPDSVIAVHSTLCFPFTVISLVRTVLATNLPSLFRTERDNDIPQIQKLTDILPFYMRETGYFHMQGTKPDTMGVGITHSPLGMAAYMLEKFIVGTNRENIYIHDGGLLEKFSIDELIDNLMIYWVTGSLATSGRIYAEQMDPNKKHQLERVPTNVPFSCQYMPEEIVVLPEYALELKFSNLQNFSVAPRGGHFAHFEEPGLVAENAISLFNTY